LLPIAIGVVIRETIAKENNPSSADKTIEDTTNDTTQDTTNDTTEDTTNDTTEDTTNDTTEDTTNDTTESSTVTEFDDAKISTSSESSTDSETIDANQQRIAPISEEIVSDGGSLMKKLIRVSSETGSDMTSPGKDYSRVIIFITRKTRKGIVYVKLDRTRTN